jgi:hypothetical protein
MRWLKERALMASCFLGMIMLKELELLGRRYDLTLVDG